MSLFSYLISVTFLMVQRIHVSIICVIFVFRSVVVCFSVPLLISMLTSMFTLNFCRIYNDGTDIWRIAFSCIVMKSLDRIIKIGNTVPCT